MEVKDMFDKLKRMFEDEEAAGIFATLIKEACGCVALCKAIDIGLCGGQGMGRGIFVPITNQLMKLIAG
jgi:hypothetical protein